MKIYPAQKIPDSHFGANRFTTKKIKSDTRDFFEAAGVVCITSIPMFIYLYLYHLYDKHIKNKKNPASKTLNPAAAKIDRTV